MKQTCKKVSPAIIRVQIHDSYQFVSKSYHDMQYHFRSIDTWLQGQCQRWGSCGACGHLLEMALLTSPHMHCSFCPEHSWSVKEFRPGKYSVFAEDESDGEEEEENCRREKMREGEGEEEADKMEELSVESIQASQNEKVFVCESRGVCMHYLPSL